MQIKGSNRISKIVTSSNSPPPPPTVTQPKLFLFLPPCVHSSTKKQNKKNPKKQQLQAENLPPTLRLYSKPFYTLCSVWTWVWVSAWPVSVCVGVCVCGQRLAPWCDRPVNVQHAVMPNAVHVMNCMWCLNATRQRNCQSTKHRLDSSTWETEEVRVKLNAG